MHELRSLRLAQRVTELVFVTLGTGCVEVDVDDVVAGAPELVGIGAHRTEEQHDLLLVVLLVRAEAQVFGHEYAALIWRRQTIGRKQLVTQNNEHRFGHRLPTVPSRAGVRERCYQMLPMSLGTLASARQDLTICFRSAPDRADWSGK